jgi:hypothetical protein
VSFYPKQGQHAVRGLALNDVYWSAKVVVGDSCLAPKVNGTPMTNYCSDRVPETLGRGGLLIHPNVEGVSEVFGYPGWPLGDWDMLRSRIDYWIEKSNDRDRMVAIDNIKKDHTYTVRMQQMYDLIDTPGVL